MNPKKFDPYNPEYKKVEDLPQEQRAEFVNLSDVQKKQDKGFVRREAEKLFRSAGYEAENRSLLEKIFRGHTTAVIDILQEEAVDEDAKRAEDIKTVEALDKERGLVVGKITRLKSLENIGIEKRLESAGFPNAFEYSEEAFVFFTHLRKENLVSQVTDKEDIIRSAKEKIKEMEKELVSEKYIAFDRERAEILKADLEHALSLHVGERDFLVKELSKTDEEVKKIYHDSLEERKKKAYESLEPGYYGQSHWEMQRRYEWEEQKRPAKFLDDLQKKEYSEIANELGQYQETIDRVYKGDYAITTRGMTRRDLEVLIGEPENDNAIYVLEENVTIPGEDPGSQFRGDSKWSSVGLFERQGNKMSTSYISGLSGKVRELVFESKEKADAFFNIMKDFKKIHEVLPNKFDSCGCCGGYLATGRVVRRRSDIPIV